MVSSSLFFSSFILLVLILTVESAYNVFSYDDENNGEEHCCLVRVRDNFCLATPITRSLVQVNRQCHRFDRPHNSRSGGKKRNNKYLDQISRRLNVQSSHEIGDKIFLELKKPLEKKMLANDLICLTSTTNNINLDKCHVELLDDSDEHNSSHRKDKRREGRRRQHRDRRAAVESHDEDEEDSLVDDETKTEGEKEIHRVELHQPVRIREGYGLLIRQTYKLNPNRIRPTNRQQRQCLSWYHKQTERIRHNPSKSCINLIDRQEKCINHLVHNTFNHNETDVQEQYTTISLPTGSKLYCENLVGSNKLLGVHQNVKLCFQKNNEVYIEHKFSDIAGLSDKKRNKDTLDFIGNNNKLSAEFGDDCHGETTLVEVTEP